jgi:hypothetical protein
MNKIKFKYGPYKIQDQNDKTRWVGILPNGKKTSRARLIMMNFLHTDNIPRVFHIHHINRDTQDDVLDNLQLMSIIDHMQLHTPRDYKYGFSSTEDHIAYQKALRNSPDYHEGYLVKRRRYYHDVLRHNATYVQKNRERVAIYNQTHRKRIGEK